MHAITGLIAQGRRPRVSLVGCGGKTSLLWALAEKNRDQKTLVSSTTKICRPNSDRCYDRFLTSREALASPALPGVTLVGDRAPEEKIGLERAEMLEKANREYDVVLLEADGSRGLPLKGWANYEPVVADFTTETVGVLPLWSLGRAADETLVHRLPLFCALTGARPGEAVTLGHLKALITAPEGLFGKARGEWVLLLNQVENDEERKTAEALAESLPAAFLAQLRMVIAGSVQRDAGAILWKT